MRALDKKLGGLDFFAVDHIGQFELLYPDCGNQIIKQIQSFAKTYVSVDGNKPVVIFAVQTNREGNKRATKRNGVYDIQAISDLNECLHFSTGTLVKNSDGTRVGRGTAGNVVSSFSSESNFIVPSVDYSTGEVVMSKVTAAAVTGTVPGGVDWYQLKYPRSGNNKIFTQNHRLLVNGVKVRLCDLPDEFLADCVDWNLSPALKQVLLGSCLGDSMYVLGKYSVTPRVVLMQGVKQLEYLKWKVSLAPEFFSVPKSYNGGVKYQSFSNSSNSLFFLKDAKTECLGGYKHITQEYLDQMDWLAWGIWYLDDGWIKWNTDTKYYIAVGCTNFGYEGACLVKSHLKKRYNLDVSVHNYPEKRSNKRRIEIQFTQASSEIFMARLRELIYVPCMSYKIVGANPNLISRIEPTKLKLVRCGIRVKKKPIFFKNSTKKYNFEVDHPDHNYVLPGGLVSANCERSSSTIVFIYTSEDMKVVQESKCMLAKNRFGATLPEPVTVSFNPAVCAVGSTVETISMSDSDFSSMDSFGDIDFGDDDVF